MSSQWASSTSGSMSEAWMIKAIRLLHSKNPEDTAKLRKMYKDACKNESLVTSITLAEALQTEEDSKPTSEKNSTSRSRISIPAAQTVSETTQGGRTFTFFDPASITPADVAAKTQGVPVVTDDSQMPVVPVVVCQGDALTEVTPTPVIVNTSGSGSAGELVPGASPSSVVVDPAAVAEGVAELFAELKCCVCDNMFAPGGGGSSVLVECAICRSLYHKMCHSPSLVGTDVPQGWICGQCAAAVTAEMNQEDVDCT